MPFLAACALQTTAALAATEGAPPTTAAHPRRVAQLDVDLPVDLAITGAAAIAWGASELLKRPLLGPRGCRWCNPGDLDWSIRNAAVWDDPRSAIKASNVIALVVTPLAAVGLTAFAGQGEHANLGDFGIDLLVIGQATALAGDLNQLVKFSVGRQRPFAHAGLPNPDTAQVGKHDDNVSFYSGHTNVTFALAASAGTVARLRGYRMGPAIWIAGAVLGATTGYLRLAADQHYFTDVLTGAVLGTAAGVAVPVLLHRPRARDGSGGLALLPTPGGAALVAVW